MLSETTWPEDADSKVRPVARVLEYASGIWTDAEAECLQSLKADIVTVRRALHGDAEPRQCLRMSAALGPMWWMNGMAKEGLDSIKKLAESADAAPDWRSLVPVVERVDPGVDMGAQVSDAWVSAATTRDRKSFEAEFIAEDTPVALLTACCLDGGGANAYATSSYPEAAELHAKAYAMAGKAAGGSHLDSCDARVLQSRALDGLGRVARETGEYKLSFQLHLAAVQRIVSADLSTFKARMRPSPLVCAANAISNAGVAAYRLDDKEQSKACHSLAKRLRESSGDLRGYSSSLGNLAKMCESKEALPLYEESLRIREQLHDTWGIAGSHRAIAAIHVQIGNGDVAAPHLVTAIPLFVQVHDNLGIAESLETLGLIWHARSPGPAAQLLGASLAVRKSIGAAVDVVERRVEAKALMQTHAKDWEIGLGMTTEHAVLLVGQFSSNDPEVSHASVL